MPNDVPDWQSPNTLLTQILANQLAIPAGGQVSLSGLAKFESLYIIWGDTTDTSMSVQYSFFDPTSSVITSQDELSTPFGPNAGPYGPYTTQVAVAGDRVQFTNFNLVSATHVTVIGSTKPAPDVPYTDANANTLDQWILPTQALVAGTIYTLPHTSGTSQIGGPVYAALQLTGTTVKGYWQIAVNSLSTPLTIVVADTTEAAIISSTIIYKQLALPRNPYVVQFNCKTAGTAQLVASFLRDR